MTRHQSGKEGGTGSKVVEAAEHRIRPAVEASAEAPRQTDEAKAPWEVLREARELVDGLECSPVPRPRRVFVNRNLRMDVVEAVGFDMDYTLAIYHHRRIESLAYRMTAEALVREKEYPEDVLDLAYEPSSVVRGLVVDKELGNTFKMDRHYHVARVHHGNRPLSKTERIRLYRKKKIRLGSKRYVWVDTLFGLPEAALYADLVDLFDQRAEKTGEVVDYTAIYDDVRELIDKVHRDGSLKRVVERDLSFYIRREPTLGQTLHRLRSSGKRLFLLTNSPWSYTNAVMSFLLDGLMRDYPSWRGYFDLVLVGAKKPAFFGENTPFREVDPTTGGDSGEEGAFPDRGGVYESGNLHDLEKATGWEGDRVLYVGDHIYGDILRTKRSGMWRTAMIVQEIEEEVAYLEARSADLSLLRSLEEIRLRLDDEISVGKAVVSEIDRHLSGRVTERVAATGGGGSRRLVELNSRQQEARAHIDRLKRALKEVLASIQELTEDLHRGMNPHWGMVFKEGHENSRFAEQVAAYACVYTGRVSNLLAYSPSRYFRSRPSLMPHELEDHSDPCRS